jgi:magnesium-transporting ATPase (P-type)
MRAHSALYTDTHAHNYALLLVTAFTTTTILPLGQVLLRGSALINEATLTGESAPQMKGSLLSAAASDSETLDVAHKHKCHVLFAGTSLVQTR